jgi:hypothetical protein
MSQLMTQSIAPSMSQSMSPGLSGLSFVNPHAAASEAPPGLSRQYAIDGAGRSLDLSEFLTSTASTSSAWAYDEATDRQCRDLSYLALPEIAGAAFAAARRSGGTR